MASRRRLQANPAPLQVVSEEERAQWWRNRLNRSRAEQRATWVRLGGDPAEWDAEHPVSPTSGHSAPT